ncbi:MAG: ECF transporter S component [Clostridiaceae bacterium]
MQKKNLKIYSKTRQLTVIGLLSSISILLSVTPLGYIPIPPISPTIMHVPVIIGAIIEGPLVGATIGAIFGITSLIRSFMVPSPTNFIFWNPLISVGVRILIGVVTGYLYKSLKNRKGSVAISAVLGSLTNTVGVLGLAYIFYFAKFAEALGLTEKAATVGILGIAATNGIPEALLSALITVSVVTAYKKSKK